MSATPSQEPGADYVAALTLKAGQSSEVLVDTRAGSHLFVKGFDPNSKIVGDSTGKSLVTVTGEPLVIRPKRRSVVQAHDGQSFSIEYNESQNVGFSFLSAGQAATKGCWTVIGPEKQCIVLDKNAEKLKKALETTKCLQLDKKRGVYWLPLKASQEPFGEVPVLAATRAAKKVVPAKAQDAAMDAGAPAPSPDAGGTAPAPSVGDAAQELPRLGKPVSEASEAVRKRELARDKAAWRARVTE